MKFVAQIADPAVRAQLDHMMREFNRVNVPASRATATYNIGGVATGSELELVSVDVPKGGAVVAVSIRGLFGLNGLAVGALAGYDVLFPVDGVYEAVSQATAVRYVSANAGSHSPSAPYFYREVEMPEGAHTLKVQSYRSAAGTITLETSRVVRVIPRALAGLNQE